MTDIPIYGSRNIDVNTGCGADAGAPSRFEAAADELMSEVIGALGHAGYAVIPLERQVSAARDDLV